MPFVRLLLGAALLISFPNPTRGQVLVEEGMAHPRRVRSFISAVHESRIPTSTQLVRMGLGDALFLAAGQTSGGTGWEVELVAGVMGEFDLGVSSFDFIAADFLVGVPVRMKRGGFTGTFRLYHQSSHLGDDVLARDDVTLDSLNAYDFEAVEVYLGQDLGPVQAYGGFEYRFRRTPDTQDPSVFHAGVVAGLDLDARGRRTLVAGIHGWLADNGEHEGGMSVRGGVELARGSRGQARGRPVRILLEGLWGQPDAGRFFRLRRSSIGVSVEVAR